MAKQAKSVNKIVASSGNVFADLGLPDAAERDTKVRLAVAVNRLLESRRLTQAAAATALSINQPKISALKHYKINRTAAGRQEWRYGNTRAAVRSRRSFADDRHP